MWYNAEKSVEKHEIDKLHTNPIISLSTLFESVIIHFDLSM